MQQTQNVGDVGLVHLHLARVVLIVAIAVAQDVALQAVVAAQGLDPVGSAVCYSPVSGQVCKCGSELPGEECRVFCRVRDAEFLWCRS